METRALSELETHLQQRKARVSEKEIGKTDAILHLPCEFGVWAHGKESARLPLCSQRNCRSARPGFLDRRAAPGESVLACWMAPHFERA